MNLHSYIQKLSQELELAEPLRSDVPGIYVFPLEDNLYISIAEVPGGFSLTSTVADCPKTREEEFITNAMMANLFGQGTGDAVLGLDESGAQVTLSRTIDFDVTYKEFSEILEDFVNSVDFWHEEANSLK